MADKEKNIDELVKALESGENFEVAAVDMANHFRQKFYSAVFPMETWVAPFVAAALMDIVETIGNTIPGSLEAAGELLQLMKNSEEGGEDADR